MYKKLYIENMVNLKEIKKRSTLSDSRNLYSSRGYTNENSISTMTTTSDSYLNAPAVNSQTLSNSDIIAIANCVAVILVGIATIGTMLFIFFRGQKKVQKTEEILLSASNSTQNAILLNEFDNGSASSLSRKNSTSTNDSYHTCPNSGEES